MENYEFVSVNEIRRIEHFIDDDVKRLNILSDICRLNALVAVKRAGSGHLGSSFSAMDIIVRLFYKEMNLDLEEWINPNRDIYFSSKGHDVPGLYSLLYSLGVVEETKLFHLRRLGGLDGHPDITVRGIEANSGSLGMGISKGRGMAWAKIKTRCKGRIFVLLGDGELQEGQNYEALQATVSHNIKNLVVIVDNNKVQSDKPVREVIDLGNLKKKFESFGWHVVRCNGHSQVELAKSFKEIDSVIDQPVLLIADTVKGCGVSFMEHPQALKDGSGYYRWHAGAPDDAMYLKAHQELVRRINSMLKNVGGVGDLNLTIWNADQGREEGSLLGEPVSAGNMKTVVAPVSDEYVVQAYGDALLDMVAKRDNVVVLDADLAADCRIRPIELQFPEKFIECGIAEQDMVSMAGGIASQGLLPVVNTFGSFLASRANEQIYNNETENKKVIYVCHYAGLIPAGPGKSHQSIRDISLFGALPKVTILQPCNGLETEQVIEYAIDSATSSCMIRLAIGPSPRIVTLPDRYRLTPGRGVELTEGDSALLFAYGPVMMNEALLASEVLVEKGIGLKVINMPWLNVFDQDWLLEVVSDSIQHIFVLEDHAPVGGLGDRLLQKLVELKALGQTSFNILAVEGFPVCGTPQEALQAHGLDGRSIAKRIEKRLIS